MKFSIIIAALIASSVASAQQPPPERPDITAYRRLLDEANQRIAQDATEIATLAERVRTLTPKPATSPTPAPAK